MRSGYETRAVSTKRQVPRLWGLQVAMPTLIIARFLVCTETFFSMQFWQRPWRDVEGHGVVLKFPVLVAFIISISETFLKR